MIYFALLELKREVSELRQLIEVRLGNREPLPPRPVFQVEEEIDEEPGTYGPSPEAAVTIGSPQTGVRSLKELEREAIEQALKRVNGNRRQAAELLGIGLRTLYRKLVDYRLK